MRRFKNILLVLGDSHLTGPAALRAIDLARTNNARLTVIDVIPSAAFGRSLQPLSGKMESLQDQLIIVRQQELEELVSESVSGVDVSIEVVSGKAFMEIIRYVLMHSCDLVVKSVEEEKRFASILFGSTDLRLLRKCPCPVWLVKPDDHAETKKVLAAIELESIDDENELNKLNRQIIDIASSLAIQESGEVHVINAWFVFDGESLAKKLSKNYKEDASKWVEEQKRSIEKAQQQFTKTFKEYLQKRGINQLDYTFHFLEGEAEDVIVDFADREEIDLVVMGTVARTDLAGFLIGNTSEAVLSQINSSVLAVKPPGFVSPITIDNR